MNKQTHPLLLVKIVIIAFITGAISLPSFLELCSPFWLLLFFTYWLIYTDSKKIITSALILGLLLDILQGGILGQNALSLVLSSAFILNEKRSFFISNLSTQQVYIFFGSVIYLIVFLLVHQLAQGLNFEWLILLAPFTGATLWPLVRSLLTKLK